tara:strand:- start:799 stop:2868 length:2070 start_codon:yes stop_codon:yes gene_type:complete
MGFRKDSDLLATTVEDYSELDTRWESEITEGWSLEEKAKFKSGDITGKNIAFGSVIGKNDKLRGEKATEDYTDYATERAKSLTPDNLDEQVALMKSEGLEFGNIDEAGAIEDNAIKGSIMDMLNDKSNIGKHEIIRTAETTRRLLTQNEINKSEDFDERHTLAFDLAFQQDEVKLLEGEFGKIKEMADLNRTLDDVESYYTTKKGYSPTDVKAIVDFASQYMPEGEKFGDDALTTDEKLDQIIVNKSVGAHLGDIGGKIKELQSLDVTSRDDRKIIAEKYGPISEALKNHGFLITLQQNKMSRTEAINQSFKNRELQSDLFAFSNTLQKDLNGDTINKKDDDVNIFKGLGRLAENYMHGAASKTIGDIGISQAMSNRLKIIGIDMVSSGKPLFAKTTAEFEETMAQIEQEVLADVEQNPDAYDRIISDRTRGEFGVPERRAFNMMLANSLQSANPRSASVAEFVGEGMTHERAESLYDSLSPSVFDEHSRINSRTPEQVQLEAMERDLRAVSSATPDIPLQSRDKSLSVSAPEIDNQSFRETVGELESTSNFNSVQDNKRLGVSDTTVTTNTVSDNIKKHGNKALGKFQIQGASAKDVMRKAGIDPDTFVFDEEGQEKIFGLLLERRGLDDFRSGKISVEEFALNVSKEWAAMPKDASGDSFYKGTGNNKALIGWDEYLELLKALKDGE